MRTALTTRQSEGWQVYKGKHEELPQDTCMTANTHVSASGERWTAPFAARTACMKNCKCMVSRGACDYSCDVCRQAGHLQKKENPSRCCLNRKILLPKQGDKGQGQYPTLFVAPLNLKDFVTCRYTEIKLLLQLINIICWCSR